MSGLPYNKRPNDVFVSYSHKDISAVKPLVKWLQDFAGLSVWWDDTKLRAGKPLAGALTTGLENARSALFCVSSSWKESSWCEEEFNAALQERRIDKRYHLIALHLDDCALPPFLSNSRYLEMRELNSDTAATLLLALAPEPPPWFHGKRDVYLSRSWHSDETKGADYVCTALYQKYGFRLIGDSPDYAAFDGNDRVKHIIQSCGALVAVLPFREDPANGFTSKWIVKEIEIARQLKRPYLLFISDGVTVDPELIRMAVGNKTFPIPSSVDDAVLMQALFLFAEEYSPSPQIAYAFFATSLREAQETERIVNLVEQITGMQFLLGQRLKGKHAQQEIIERIRNAQFVIADISANNLNSLIEAGVALGTGTHLHLISRPPESGELKTRFMFSDREIDWYKNSLDKVGVIHRIARLYRRRVFSSAVS